MKRVELLAPAGNYESFLGAIRAGADAVYLAGNKFGARAYADNFSEEEVCKAIRYAHLYQKKVYLTVNILLKQEELETLYEYLLPFYQNGLDGVIIQDMGVFCYIKEKFPLLELHISTQMAVTGVNGARLLKKEGAFRIVPARELSLEEIKAIKREVEIEIETFVHGALCYCYSGECLFSSVLGGRSGNRGRCAQPCRLPYEVMQHEKCLTKGETYPLSLKDLCTLQMIPELIEAGIDSFKIEGRMKKSEYAAGVTALYRKNIDKYYANPKNYTVDKEDIATIHKLYIRSEMQNGYYKKHNGKEMVTLSKPSYSQTEEALLTDIRQKYLDIKKQLPITGRLCLQIGKPAECIVSRGEVTVSVYGEVVQAATGRPLLEENIKKQILKTGTSPFVFTELDIEMDTNLFLSLKACNELRREALSNLENKLLESKLREVPKDCGSTKAGMKQENFPERKQSLPIFAVSAASKEQFETAVNASCVNRIYLSADCLIDGYRILEEREVWYREQAAYNRKELYLALPYILRMRSCLYMEQIRLLLEKETVAGVLVRNLEELGWLEAIAYSGKLVTDASLYCFNSEAKNYFRKTSLTTVPYELNLKEVLRLGIDDMEIPVYGRIPMMLTANCIRNTVADCKKDGNLLLKDRFRKEFPVITNCIHCYNVIYNCQPSSLHGYIETFLKHGVFSIRLDFTVEDTEETRKVIAFFEAVLNGQKANLPYQEYTKGHFGRGVE